MAGIVFFDLDGTMVCGQTQQMLIKYLFHKNRLNFFYLLISLLWFALYKIRVVRNVEKIMSQSYKIIKGWDYEDTQILIKDFFDTEIKKKIYPQAIAIIKKYQLDGKDIVIISNTPQIIVNEIIKYFNLSHGYGTRLEIINNKFTGKISGHAVYGIEKVNLIKREMPHIDFNKKNTISYSDHYSDIPLLKLTSKSFVVNPDKKLKIAAIKNKWQLVNFFI